MPEQICACGRIDVHAHFLPECYVEALAVAGLKTLDGGFPVPVWSEDAALAMMDRQRIATAIVSLTSPASHFLPSGDRAALCRTVNLAGAEMMKRRPDRFGYLACLPMNDVDAALAEIAHAFDELGVDGVVLESQVDGIYLGAPALAPVFEELNRRGAVLFIHPTSPACFEAVALGRPAPMIEFPFDTTRTVVDLLYARRLQENSALKVIIPHCGAALPSLVARIASFANLPSINPRPASEAEVFETLARLYYDVAVSAHPTAVDGLLRLAPLSQILFGSDWPFAPEMVVARNLQFLAANEALDDSKRRQIDRDNAVKLFPRLARP